MLIPFDPLGELDRWAVHAVHRTRGRRPAGLPMDAYRRGDRLVVHFDLPGVHPDSVELTVERNVLTVRAERSFTPAEGDETLVAERPVGTFVRRLSLGRAVDGERIEASYDHGVLTVTVPVAEEAKPRRLPISTGTAA